MKCADGVDLFVFAVLDRRVTVVPLVGLGELPVLVRVERLDEQRDLPVGQFQLGCLRVDHSHLLRGRREAIEAGREPLRIGPRRTTGGKMDLLLVEPLE